MNIPLIAQIRQSPLVQNLINNNRLEMDNSMYVNWSCNMKGLLSHVLKLRPRGKGSLALDYGTAIHAGLEQFMLGRDFDSASEAFIKVATELNIDKWLDDKRCTSRGLETLASWQMYRHNLIHDYQTIDLTVNGNKTKAVELGVRKRICNIPETCVGDIEAYWIGRVDAVVKYKGKLWILDHKTSSMLGDKFLDDKMRSNQFIGYWYTLNDVIEQEYGTPLAGVLLNTICTGRKELHFETYELPFSKWQIEEWLEETKYRLTNITNLLLNIYNGKDWTMIERELCVTKYGKCPFFDACNTVLKARDSILTTSYDTHDWSPHEGTTIIEG